jgi:hypothetical protein
VQAKRLWPWIFYGVLVLAGMMTLYYMALIWLVHLVWIMWRHRGSLWWYALAAYAAAAIVFLPWFLLCWPSLQHAGLWVGPPTIKEEYEIFSLMLTYAPVWMTTPLTLSMVIGTLLILATLTVMTWQRSSKEQRHATALLMLYFLLPVGMLILASTPPLHPAFLYRYFAHTFIGGYALMGVVAALAWRRWPRSMLVRLGGVAMLGVLVFGTFTVQTIGNENLDAHRLSRAKETVQFLQVQRAGVIVADTPELYFELDHYMPGNKNLYFFDGNYPVLPYGGLAALYGSPQQVQDVVSLHASPLWFVYSTPKPKLQLPRGHAVTQIYQNDKYRVELVY